MKTHRDTARRHLRAISACLVVAAFAIAPLLGATDASAQGQQAAPGAPDVCTLLPKEEASKILGRTVMRTRSAKRTEGAMECRYMAGMAGTITIVVGGGVPKAKWDAFMKELTVSGAKLEPVTGIGDGANFWDDNRLYAHVGNYEITVNSSPTPGAAAANIRADAVVLAKAIVAKLTAK